MDFKALKEHNQKEITASERILEANNILKTYNWQFINPYMQGYRISSIINHHNNGTLTQEKVAQIFISDFFNLNSTISFIDGFFKRSKYIEPFNYYIEYSLILCFQQDYAAAINLLLPAIEGILASYLSIAKKIDLSANNRYERIKKTIDIIKQDIIEMYINKDSSTFNKQQKDFLISQERRYLDNWFLVINSFLKDSVFAHSNHLENGNLLNRHLILHQIKITKYHSLENYIKLFNSIKFLFWVFSKIESISLLNEIDTKTFIKKRIQYEEIIEKSKKIIIHKHAILNSYNLHDKSDYNLFGDFKSIYGGLPWKHRLILTLQRRFDNLKSKIALGSLRPIFLLVAKVYKFTHADKKK